ncbi:MAG: carbon-nitrogen hydrolase family protein [Pseudomonadota bacterium]
MDSPLLKVAAVQMAPVYLDAAATWDKLEGRIREAASNGAELVAWGESLIPGYPNWTSITTGDDQKPVYARYWREAPRLDGPIIAAMKELAGSLGVMLMGGIAEQEGGSTWCTLITIGPDGELWGRHRKLKPTWRERLVWADGDGEGLRTYPTKIGRVGGLSCWENWMPLARAALHGQEEILHIATWPGKLDLTKDITRFAAIEGRSWVVSAAGMLRAADWAHLSDDEFPLKSAMSKQKVWQDGGSMIVNPKGEIVAGPLVGEEGVLYADIDPQMAIEERQTLDCSGHYARNDVFRLTLHRDED